MPKKRLRSLSLLSDYDVSTYGERIADVYDHHSTLPKTAPLAVEFLAGLVGKGTALELGIGTGRIALPLAAKGAQVSGIDASPAMVRKMRAKAGGKRIPVTIGDFEDAPIIGQFDLIYVVFNTFFSLLTQEAQVRCFALVAGHLKATGAFVIEAFPPDLSRFDRGQRTSLIGIDTDHATLDVAMHDAVNQRVRTHHVDISSKGVKLYPVALRYAYPSELDLMAQLVGLRLRERWGGWNREEFTAASAIHVSIYELGSSSQ
jgi:SAM-dependent methyltransferase